MLQSLSLICRPPNIFRFRTLPFTAFYVFHAFPLTSFLPPITLDNVKYIQRLGLVFNTVIHIFEMYPPPPPLPNLVLYVMLRSLCCRFVCLFSRGQFLVATKPSKQTTGCIGYRGVLGKEGGDLWRARCFYPYMQWRPLALLHCPRGPVQGEYFCFGTTVCTEKRARKRTS